jgi:hypothetical protein
MTFAKDYYFFKGEVTGFAKNTLYGDCRRNARISGLRGRKAVACPPPILTESIRQYVTRLEKVVGDVNGEDLGDKKNKELDIEKSSG